MLLEGRMQADARMHCRLHNAPLLRSRHLHRQWHRPTVPNIVRSVPWAQLVRWISRSGCPMACPRSLVVAHPGRSRPALGEIHRGGIG
jgi:hypothetical protein